MSGKGPTAGVCEHVFVCVQYVGEVDVTQSRAIFFCVYMLEKDFPSL